MSQASVAKQIGMAQPSFVKIEKGGDTTKWPDLARVLRSTVDYLRDGIGPEDFEHGNSTTPPRPITAFYNEDELEPGQYVYLPTVNMLLSAASTNRLTI